MSTHEFEFEAFQDNFTPLDEEFGDWAGVSVEMTVKWHPAEPDVGIFGKQAEIVAIAYYLGDQSFRTSEAFAAAFVDAYGHEIEETVEDVVRIVDEQVNEWESELEDE